MAKTIRVTLDLGMAASERLRRLQDALDETKVGIFKRSLELLEHVIAAIEDGYKIQLVRDDETVGVEILGLGRSQRNIVQEPRKQVAVG